MKWRDINIERPANGTECLITDGELKTCGTYSHSDGMHPESTMHWTGCWFGGYEWDWDIFKVTHWIPMTEIPGVDVATATNGGQNEEA